MNRSSGYGSREEVRMESCEYQKCEVFLGQASRFFDGNIEINIPVYFFNTLSHNFDFWNVSSSNTV